jgi:hypothetical protein
MAETIASLSLSIGVEIGAAIALSARRTDLP